MVQFSSVFSDAILGKPTNMNPPADHPDQTRVLFLSYYKNLFSAEEKTPWTNNTKKITENSQAICMLWVLNREISSSYFNKIYIVSYSVL